MARTKKGMYDSTFHRDGTVTFWDVYEQQWRRMHVCDFAPRLLSTLGHRERDRILRSRKRYC